MKTEKCDTTGERLVSRRPSPVCHVLTSLYLWPCGVVDIHRVPDIGTTTNDTAPFLDPSLPRPHSHSTIAATARSLMGTVYLYAECPYRLYSQTDTPAMKIFCYFSH